MAEGLKSSLDRLAKKPKKGKGPLPAASTRADVKGGRGEGLNSTGDEQRSSNLASPFVEKEGTRVHHSANADWVSSDGFFTISRKRVKKLFFEDDNGSTVEYELKDVD